MCRVTTSSEAAVVTRRPELAMARFSANFHTFSTSDIASRPYPAVNLAIIARPGLGSMTAFADTGQSVSLSGGAMKGSVRLRSQSINALLCRARCGPIVASRNLI